MPLNPPIENRIYTTDFFGSGNPNEQKIVANSGIEFTDVHERIRYKQITIPYGKAWTIVATEVLVSFPQSTADGFDIVLISSTPYNITSTTGNTIYLVDCTAASVVINLPTAVGNEAIYGVKKIDNTRNTVTIIPSGAELIDGATSQTIRFQWTEADFFSDNVNFFIK